ncbi:MAG: DUF819 family protein [Fretibacterium sp.]|nr:DUF819 family protein [Fretibacterium sp.]
MGFLWKGTLVSADDTWVLWATIITFAAASIYLEQRYRWAEKLSGPVLGLIMAIVAVNLNILPTDAPVYDAIWTYCIPLAVSMLLFRADIKAILRDTGKMFFCFNISALGTLAGVVVAFFLLKGLLPHPEQLAAMATGGYIGGGVNIFAVVSSLGVSETLLSAYMVSDNFMMALAFMALLWIPSSQFFTSRFRHPYEAKFETQGSSASEAAQTKSAAFWGKKEISLLDIALTVATAFVISTLSVKFAGLLKTTFAAPEGGDLWSQLPAMILGNEFVILTILSVLAASLFPNYFKSLKGAQEIGTFIIYAFFVVIGCPAVLKDVILTAPLLFVFSGLIALINIVWTLFWGKLFRQNIEELAVASNANLGGPSTAAAMAVGKGYDELVIPAILVGLWGYIIGTPLGLFMATWLKQYL